MSLTKILIDDRFTLHQTGSGHPERPSRIFAIKNSLIEAGYLSSVNQLTPQSAQKKDILRCHSESYYQLVEKEIQLLQQTLQPLSGLSTGDVIISPASLDIALLAAGGVITAVDEVMQGQAQNVFCAIRPPGHHACSQIGMGFCLFNNVAIGTRYLQQIYPAIQRILIVDWDVHHGNGTQEIFYDDPSVYYFSTHQKGIYPGTGSPKERGGIQAPHTTLNVPIDPNEHSTKTIFEAFERLEKEMEVFQPQFIFVSCGFDAHELDPLGGLNLTTEEFGRLTSCVCHLADKYCQKKLISVLEGGYNLEALSSASLEHVKKLASSN